MWCREKNRGAFTFVELLVSMSIIGLIGAVAVTALWFIVGNYHQMDDYTSENEEMQYAVQKLSRSFALTGLGMPNNRQGKGSFSAAFTTSAPPVMSLLFSADDAVWGGPVSVASANTANNYTAAGIKPGTWKTDAGLAPTGAYVGPELYYVYAVPTGVKAQFKNAGDASDTEARNETKMVIDSVYHPHPPNSPADSYLTGGDYLRDFQYEGQAAGLQAADSAKLGENLRSWLLFPTLRLPMILEKLESRSLEVQVAPETMLPVRSTIMGLDEIHLIRAARLYRNGNNELVRVAFKSGIGAGAQTEADEILAHNIVGLQFTYNPSSRLLTMYMAARGTERDPAGRTGGGGQPVGWPAWIDPIAANDLHYRVLVKSLTWRIRN